MIVVVYNGDHALCAVHQATWIDSLLKVVLHPVHRRMPASEQPLLQSTRFLVHTDCFRHAAPVEADALGLTLELSSKG